MSDAMNNTLFNGNHNNDITTKASYSLSTATVAGAYPWVRDMYTGMARQ